MYIVDTFSTPLKHFPTQICGQSMEKREKEAAITTATIYVLYTRASMQAERMIVMDVTPSYNLMFIV